jgi:hypothetical protein
MIKKLPVRKLLSEWVSTSAARPTESHFHDIKKEFRRLTTNSNYKERGIKHAEAGHEALKNGEHNKAFDYYQKAKDELPSAQMIHEREKKKSMTVKEEKEMSILDHFTKDACASELQDAKQKAFDAMYIQANNSEDWVPGEHLAEAAVSPTEMGSVHIFKGKDKIVSYTGPAKKIESAVSFYKTKHPGCRIHWENHKTGEKGMEDHSKAKIS